jgi:hypothetical protein
VKRFNVLENKMLIFPEKATIITKACCILHNIIMDKEGAPSEIQGELQLQTTQTVAQSQLHQDQLIGHLLQQWISERSS